MNESMDSIMGNSMCNSKRLHVHKHSNQKPVKNWHKSAVAVSITNKGTTVCAYIFAGVNFCGLQIYTIFLDFIFADEGVVYILDCTL